ncbi:MAG: hypothetical protein HY695_08380 [Deltaproteobacteria bacterium]|nr:hypothetical protein [Deltaproteobacteria bacterium]
MRERTRFEHEITDVGEREIRHGGLPFRVVDAGEKSLSGARYVVSQDGNTDAGALDSQGRARFVRVDPARAFRLHVEGRACAIVEGAVLLIDNEEVEYGGQFVDWRLADDPKRAEREFWPQYTAERKRAPSGPVTFWQHDHIMRRPVRLRSSYLSSPGTKIATFQAVPLHIRVGPLVRFVDDSQALVWVETETPGLVRVSFRKTADQVNVPRPGRALTEVGLASRHGATVRAGGRHFALVCLNRLEPDTVYQYTLHLAPLPVSGAIPQEESDFRESVFPKTLPPEVLQAQERELASCSFRSDKWLFFRTLRSTYERLRFAHGSCRKWPGDTDTDGTTPGPDMLSIFGSEWMAKQKIISEWPRFLLHTGDQIYADDIGFNQGKQIAGQRFAAQVPGPKDAQELIDGAWAGRFAHRFVGVDPKKLAQSAPVAPLQQREKQLLTDLSRLRTQISAIARKERSVTSEMRAKIKEEIMKSAKLEEVRRHLKAARERNLPSNYVTDPTAMRFRYLITNHLLWQVPIDAKDAPEVKPLSLQSRDGKTFYASAGDLRGIHAADYAEYSYLYERAWTAAGAKKALAHLPSFMIFDDHEITDDWNFNRNWVEIAHDSPGDSYRMWPKTITDGLIAYWMYQGWGNLSPAAWSSDPRVEILLRARAKGKDALPELRRLVWERAAKPARPGTAPSKRLTWYYALPLGSPRFLVVDDRTEREVFGAGGPFQNQLQWLQKKLAEERSSAAFVVFPTPYLLPHPISWAMAHEKWARAIKFLMGLFELRWDWVTIEQLARNADMEHAAGNQVWDEVKAMLAKLQDSVTSLKTIVFLSGDIHFSCNFDGQLKKNHGQSFPPHLLQLVSSPLRHRVSKDKQALLKNAYRYLWFETTGTHRDLTVRLAGLEGDKNSPHFLFQPSVALVDVDLRKTVGHARIRGDELPNVGIRQQHLTWNAQAAKMESRDFYYANNEATGPRLLTPARSTR